jgi:hypothetical protein
MTLRDDISEINDHARSLLQDLGMRYYVVIAEADSAPNQGLSKLVTPILPTQVKIDPNPRVRNAPSNTAVPGGLVEAGDIIMDRVSRLSYSIEDIKSKTYRLNPTLQGDRWVGGTTYRVVSVDELQTQYRVVLRRISR